MLINHYFCPIPFNFMKMKNLCILLALTSMVALASCGKFGKSSKGLPNDGQLHGVALSKKYLMPKPPGMVYIPPGTFHMGPSDEDVNFAYTARNKQVSINGFWMDATEITNAEYRQFVVWVRDSIAAKLMGFVKNSDGIDYVDWKKAQTIKWGDKATIEKIDQLIFSPENRIFGKKEIDASKLVYHSEIFDTKEAARRENASKPRSQFMIKKDVKIYPDTLAWIRDFSYSYNEPQTKRYFSHPAFNNYPVVGVNWNQATAFCEWRTNLLNSYLESKNRAPE